jgi:hypothetical protein
MSKGAGLHPKTDSTTKSNTSALAKVQRLTLFGSPQLLEGEDAAAYDELLGRVCAAVKPVDIIDEMFIADVVSLEWEVLRFDMDSILDSAKAHEAEELIQDYVQRKPTAIKLADKLLAGANSSIDALMVGELPGALDKIERIDRLTTIAETRRNAMLREIDRRTLRRQVQEVEGEFEVIEKTPAEAKSAA